MMIHVVVYERGDGEVGVVIAILHKDTQVNTKLVTAKLDIRRMTTSSQH